MQCVCRPDLVAVAHDWITKSVVANCAVNGQNADVDVAQAIKIYNDYCSVNGFDIPGYTYIMTSTAVISTGPTRLSTAQPTVTNAAVPYSTTSGYIAATNTLNGGPIATVTVTVSTSAASRVLATQILRIIYLMSVIPLGYIYALAETLVVTLTPSTLSPAVSSTATAFVTIQTAPDVRTEVVYVSSADNEKASRVTTGSGDSTGEGSTQTSNSASSSGKDTGALTQLEIMGIVIGIITALITMVVTVWMCAKGPVR